MVRCRPITLGQSEPTRPDSTAHHRRQSAGLSPVETTVTSGLCEVGEFDRLTIAEMFLCDPGARDGAAGALLLDGGRGAHQAASGVSEWDVRPRVGRLRIQRRSSSNSMTVDLPAFLAISAPSRIASKIRVRLTPALTAASSGLKPSRGTPGPVVLDVSMVAQPLRFAASSRTQPYARGRGCNPGFFKNSRKCRDRKSSRKVRGCARRNRCR